MLELSRFIDVGLDPELLLLVVLAKVHFIKVFAPSNYTSCALQDKPGIVREASLALSTGWLRVRVIWHLTKL